VADLLAVADVCIETSEARARLLVSRGKGHQEEGTIGRSTPRNEKIRRTSEDTAIAENNTLIRRKGDPFDAPTTQRSGVRSITPMDMI
jgi:hypothetical protein